MDRRWAHVALAAESALVEIEVCRKITSTAGCRQSMCRRERCLFNASTGDRRVDCTFGRWRHCRAPAEDDHLYSKLGRFRYALNRDHKGKTFGHTASFLAGRGRDLWRTEKTESVHNSSPSQHRKKEESLAYVTDGAEVFLGGTGSVCRISRHRLPSAGMMSPLRSMPDLRNDQRRLEPRLGSPRLKGIREDQPRIPSGDVCSVVSGLDSRPNSRARSLIPECFFGVVVGLHGHRAGARRNLGWIVRRLVPEFLDAFADGATNFRQLTCAENDDNDDQNDHQFLPSERAEH